MVKVEAVWLVVRSGVVARVIGMSVRSRALMYWEIC
jgi:hypothetical protein